MTQYIDLGKLRFQFAGEWLVTTSYETNDVVKYGGNVYVYTFALKTAGVLPTATSHWALMVEGFKFKGVFSTSTNYRIGDGVAHGGKVYVCIVDTVNVTPPNSAYWSQFADGIQYEGTYSSSGIYQKNDVVVYGGSTYIAKQDSTNNLPTATAFWDKFVEGVSVKAIYNNSTVYVPNDLVAYGANIYKAKVDTTGHLPTETSYWDIYLAGFSYLGVWSPATAYKIGQTITYGGSLFQAVIDSTNVNPTVTTSWTRIVGGISNKGDWTTATAYGIDEVVTYGGNTYITLLPHASTVFATDLAAGAWRKYNSGIRWRGAWATSTLYLPDDIVKDAVGSAYIATATHTSAPTFVQDSAKWSQFVVGGSDVLPPIVNGDTGRSLTVGVSGNLIDWTGATESNKIFYVAPHGVDTLDSGRNLATPFATLKYATEQCGTNATIFVKTGTYDEQLPIIVPDHTAIVGDSQRTVTIQAKAGLSTDGITSNANSSMFLMGNGSILNKMTFKGMTGWVTGTTAEDITTSTIKGVVVRFNPASPVMTKSPYVLECAAICSGAIGALIDGSIHAAGARTMIFHGYTVISDNGVGYWVKDGGKAEIVSCFTYYCYFGYSATGGGFIRALNGNNSYGTWGAVSRGYDTSETPITGALVGQQINFLYGNGSINENDIVTGPNGSATVTNVQYSANKLYVKNATGTFTLGDALTFTSGGTGTVSAGALENQKGFVLVVTNLTAAPKPGSSISLVGDTYAYVIQSVSGTYINNTSTLVLILSQEKPTGSPSGTVATVRTKYSQIRLTGHDFLSIGTGGVTTTNYPGLPTQPAAQGNETEEAYPGRVFYVSTDQDGNFRVGEYFRIDQATGRATLNANAFDLAGLTSLKLGSIGAQLGETINEFSSDATLSGDSNVAVPTEHAVKAYVDSRNASTVAAIDATTIYPLTSLITDTDNVVGEDEVKYITTGTVISSTVAIEGAVILVDITTGTVLQTLVKSPSASTTLTGSFLSAKQQYSIPDWVTVTVGTTSTVSILDIPRTYLF
jgi:hypothetical protein